MATDYYFVCNHCKKRSCITYSRQAWGWGNCWPTNTFNFLIKHTRKCGEENISVVSEDFFDMEDDDEIEKHDLRGFLDLQNIKRKNVNTKNFCSYLIDYLIDLEKTDETKNSIDLCAFVLYRMKKFFEISNNNENN